MLQLLLNKKYLIYGGSIIISRGLEFFVIFLAAYLFTKNEYGEFEYYKKNIEILAVFLSFGFPSLLISYTKSKESKFYFFIISFFIISLLGVFIFIIAYFFNIKLLILSSIFYAIFFTGGIIQSYILIMYNSNYTSFYKIIISIVFYIITIILITKFSIKESSFIYSCIILLPISYIIISIYFFKYKINFKKLKHYFRLFKKLIIGSFTMLISDFANILFLYTDIFIIKYLSESPNTEIANFSFSLNICSILLIIPTTIIQVNIEFLKTKGKNVLKIISNQINILIIICSIILIIIYYILVNSFYLKFQSTYFLFLFILLAKIFQGLSNLYGTNLLILKLYRINLYINIIFLFVNLILCFLLYNFFQLYGIAIGSIISLALRFYVLFSINKKAKVK